MVARLLGVLTVMLVMAVVGAWFAGPALMTPRVTAALTRASGHTATIGGLHATWVGGPGVRIDDLVLANAPWGSRPELLRVARLTATLDLTALRGGVLRVGSVRLEHPDLLLERDPQGRGNWETLPLPAPATSEQRADEPGSRPTAIELGSVAVLEGQVAYRDGRNSHSATVDGTAEPTAEAVHVAATLRNEAADLRVDGTVDRRAPLQQTRLSVTGRIAVPEPFDIMASLSPQPGGQAVTVTASGGGLRASAGGLVDPVTMRPTGAVALDASLAEHASAPARLGGVAVIGPASLHALVHQDGQTIVVRDLRVSAPAGDVSGELVVQPAGRPSVRGSLASRRLDLAALLAIRSLPAAAPAPIPASATPKPAPLMPAALDLRMLDRGDLDVRLAIAELADGHVTLHEVAGHLVLRDGKLALDPFAGTGPGGRAEMALHADARAQPPTLALTLRAPALAIQPLARLAGFTGEISGLAALDADLRASGLSQPELLRTLAGRAALSMGNGDIDLHVFADMLAAAHLPFDPHGRAHLRCLILRATLQGGVAHVDPLVVDANQLLVQGNGRVDLGQQTLELRLRPLLRTGPGLEVPMTLSGPWRQPRIGVDRGDLGGVLAGLLTPAGDPCRAAGVAADTPPPAPKPFKPADLLRSLLR